MSSFNADRKREHEQLAKKFYEEGNYEMAFFHTTEAADFTFKLAKQCEGDIAWAYLKNANNLLASAKEIKEMLGMKLQGNTINDADLQETSIMQLKDIPEERLSDISGMEEAKRYVINNVIDPIRNPQKAEKYAKKRGGALLLYGLPGTGKTFFARAVAGELGLPFYVLDSSKIMDKFVGGSQKAIKALFDTARTNPMSVIFIDETNEILPSRNDSNVHETTKSVANIILQELDGVDSKDKNPFLLIGATNYPGNLDDAALSRFRKQVEVDLPDPTTRRFILEREIRRMKLQFEDAAFDYLAERTEGFSCRDIVNCAEELGSISAEKEIDVFSLEFCKENFVDCHVESQDVAQSILEFKKRIGKPVYEKKK